MGIVVLRFVRPSRRAESNLDNIQTANELASHVELGKSGPVAERLKALADLIICQNVKGRKLCVVFLEQRHN
jgi:hypothetical protein